MDPLCAPVYLDLTEMDETAQVKAFRLLFPRYDLTCLFVFVFLIVCLICTFLLCFFFVYFDKVVTLALIFLTNGRK